MIDNNVKVYRRLGNTPDGKVLYEVKDNYTQKCKKITIPNENADKYEKLCDKVSVSSLKTYTADEFKRKVGVSSVIGGISSAGISLLFAKNKKVLRGVSGAILGCIAGAIGCIGYFVNKVSKFLREAQKLGIEDYKEA